MLKSVTKDDNNARRSPINAKFIDEVQVFHPENINQHTNNHYSPKHEDGLVLAWHEIFSPKCSG